MNIQNQAPCRRVVFISPTKTLGLQRGEPAIFAEPSMVLDEAATTFLREHLVDATSSASEHTWRNAPMPSRAGSIFSMSSASTIGPRPHVST